jgi:hypothetical protein
MDFIKKVSQVKKTDGSYVCNMVGASTHYQLRATKSKIMVGATSERNYR